MKSKTVQIQRQPLVEQVIEQLQRLIESELEVGVKLPSEPELMTQFGVSRSTLREAVRVLTHIGLLEVRQGDGTYVRAKTELTELARRLQQAAIEEVYEVRRILELEIARLAAQRRDEVDLAQMQESLQHRERARQTGDAAAFLEADVVFHLAVAVSSKNAVLVEVYQTFVRSLREALAQLIRSDKPVGQPEQAQLHQQLLDAIAVGDANAAVCWTEEILNEIQRQLP
jgi:DNA-binding FadR family transcriptional regulator